MTKSVIQLLKYFTEGLVAVATGCDNLLIQGVRVPEGVDPFHACPTRWVLGFASACAMLTNFVLNKPWKFREMSP